MADIKIYGKLVANTEEQVVADASSIQDTARNQKLSATLDELAQGTGLKVLEVNLNNYLSQDGLLALIQGINYATVGDSISYQFSSSIAVDSSYNAVHVTASVSGQGGIDLYLLKSINEQFSCMSIKNQGYSAKYTIVQNASLIAYGGYIRGIVIFNSLGGNLCDLVNGRSELTSTKLTYWFPVGVLPTHIKLANDIIIDLQGNEYCAIGDETIDAEISNRVYLNVVKIDINGDFSNVSANDVKVVDFLWHHIENPNNFSFDDLPRFSDSSDVADFPGSNGGSGSGGSGKLYEYKFNLQAYDINGDLDSFNVTGGANNITTLPITIQIYESNWEKVKTKLNNIAQMMGLTISANTPQDLVSIVNSIMSETQPSSSAPGYSLLYYLVSLADKSDLILTLQENGISVDLFFSIVGAHFIGKLYICDGSGVTYLNLGGLNQETGYEYIDGLNVNNSCTLTEYGTSASGGDTPSQNADEINYLRWHSADEADTWLNIPIPKYAEQRLFTAANNLLEQEGLPANISSLQDIVDLYDAMWEDNTYKYSVFSIVLLIIIIGTGYTQTLSFYRDNNGYASPCTYTATPLPSPNSQFIQTFDFTILGENNTTTWDIVQDSKHNLTIFNKNN